MHYQPYLTDFTAECPKCDKALTHADFPCKNCGKDVYRLWDTSDGITSYEYRCQHCDTGNNGIYCPDDDCHTRISERFVKPVLPEPEGAGGGCGAAAAVMLGLGLACALASAELL